ncbi:hypothetical protein [Kordia jejudonensis]|uniref:hypothetical protein n=1 Tax=Kordia jejudonensis TaxID=1348245 RepID=UPI0006296A93|nr:hypothetical protein [Kordia jejudonensis]
MKKKDFTHRLNLGKKVISNLQQRTLFGGTDAVSDPIQITTIKWTDKRICTGGDTEDVCPIDTTRVTTIPPTCMDACHTEACSN